MPKISVMNLTARPGGIDILWANMKRQSFTDWELVIVDGLWREREKEVKEYINDPRLVYVRQSDKREGAHTNLAHADNEGFRACSGELIVALQDYIWIAPDGLEKYWFHYKNTDPTGLFTGVGHQYGKPSAKDIVFPDGKITVFEEPYTKRPEMKVWNDIRINPNRNSLSLAQPVEWELNWASIPRKIIYEIGGMDEQFDYEGFAWDNTYIAYKAMLNDYKIYLDQTNECMGFDHDGWWPNKLKVEKISPSDYFHEKVKKMINGGLKPKDDYLNIDNYVE